MFARHGMLVLSPRALRRLDRVNCLVMPADLVSSEQFTVGDVFALRGLSRAQALLMARRMFASDRPLRVRHEDGYTLGPVNLLECDLDADLEVSMAERTRRGELVLGLARQIGWWAWSTCTSRRRAACSRRSAWRARPACTSCSPAMTWAPPRAASRTTSSGSRVAWPPASAACRARARWCASSVAGRPTATPRPTSAWRSTCATRPRPGASHLVCPDDARLVETVVTACTNARTVSEQSVRMAIGAAALGTLVSTHGVAARRVMFVLNAASLGAMVNAAPALGGGRGQPQASRRSHALARARHARRAHAPRHHRARLARAPAADQYAQRLRSEPAA